MARFWSGKDKKTGSSKKTVKLAKKNRYQLVPSNYQHIGDRDNQEDSFAISDLHDEELVKKHGVLALVADGMGGLSFGEEASRVAAQVFLQESLPEEPGESPPARLHRALLRANAAVYDCAYRGGNEIDLGTTLVATLVCKSEMHWISAGDSRIYHYRKGFLTQLNREHTYKNQLLDKVDNGLLTREEADNHPEGAYLTSFLGLPSLSEIDQSNKPLQLQAGDHILLCSDGLTNTMTDDEITYYFKENEHISAEELVNQALSKRQPYQDNITVVILSCNFTD